MSQLLHPRNTGNREIPTLAKAAPLPNSNLLEPLAVIQEA